RKSGQGGRLGRFVSAPPVPPPHRETSRTWARDAVREACGQPLRQAGGGEIKDKRPLDGAHFNRPPLVVAGQQQPRSSPSTSPVRGLYSVARLNTSSRKLTSAASPKNNGHSADVRMPWYVNGRIFSIGRLGPEFLILDDPAECPRVAAEITLSIDGRERRW